LITDCGRHNENVLSVAIKGEENGLEYVEGQELDQEKLARVERMYNMTTKPTLPKDLPPGQTSCRALLEDKVTGPYEDCWIDYHFKITRRSPNSNSKVIQITYEPFDSTKHCPISISTGAVMGIITGTIVLLGLLLLLLWKMVMKYLDRQELLAFNKDIMNNKFWKEENPLYTPAETTTKNPVANTRK